jgi:hypothetical protein
MKFLSRKIILTCSKQQIKTADIIFGEEGADVIEILCYFALKHVHAEV